MKNCSKTIFLAIFSNLLFQIHHQQNELNQYLACNCLKDSKTRPTPLYWSIDQQRKRMEVLLIVLVVIIFSPFCLSKRSKQGFSNAITFLFELLKLPLIVTLLFFFGISEKPLKGIKKRALSIHEPAYLCQNCFLKRTMIKTSRS